MAYNNYNPNYMFPNYPMYQPMQQMTPQIPIQPQSQPQQTPQTPQIQNGGFISVRSEAEARNYPVAPGNSVTFFDETARYCYTKTSVSQLEAPRFERYKLVKEDEPPVNAPVSNETSAGRKVIEYATNEQIQAIEGEIQALRAELSNMQNKKTEVGTEPKRTAQTKKEGDEV